MKTVRYILLMTLGTLAAQGLAVGFGSGTPNRRLTAPNMCDRNRDRNQGAQSSQEAGQRTTRTSAKATSSSDVWGDWDDEDDAKPNGKAKKPVRVLSPEAKSIKGDIKVELGEGHGETREEALKEALKDVLQKVVGVYVDSEFRMNNDEIIKDQIITHSNGLIEKYKVLDEAKDENGCGIVITIRARVKIRDFVARIQKIAPSQTVAVDGALMASDIGNQLNAEALLRKELEDFDLTSLMDVKIEKSIKPEIQSSKDGVVVMRYAYTVRYSPKKYYKEFLPRLDRVLTQIAKGKPKTTVFEGQTEKIDIMPGNNGGFGSRNSHRWEGRSIPVPFVVLHPARFYNPGKGIVSAVWKITAGGMLNIREWTLSDHLARLFAEMCDDAYRRVERIQCVLSVLDEGGEEMAVGVDQVNVYRAPLLGQCSFYPAFADSFRALGSKYVGFIDISINAEDVSRIKSLRIKLETNSKGR